MKFLFGKLYVLSLPFAPFNSPTKRIVPRYPFLSNTRLPTSITALFTNGYHRQCHTELEVQKTLTTSRKVAVCRKDCFLLHAGRFQTRAQCRLRVTVIRERAPHAPVVYVYYARSTCRVRGESQKSKQNRRKLSRCTIDRLH